MLAAILAMSAGLAFGQSPQAEPALPIPAPIVPALPPIEEPQSVFAQPPADAGKLENGEKTEKDDCKSDPCDRKTLTDSLHDNDDYGLKSLFDSIRKPGTTGAKWYDTFNLRGYTQFRFGRTLDDNGVDPFLFGDRSINGVAENFTIRRARLILSSEVSDHLFFFFQPDFAITPPSSDTGTLFFQVRDLYGDVYLDKDKVHRFRVGKSMVPYAFENMVASQNRAPLDRTDAMNTGTPGERDIGVFYYWTPVEKQQLLTDLVAGGLKGTGNYGIVGLGVYNGQGGGQLEQNQNLHTVARVTYPFRLPSGQVVEASVAGYTGEFVVEGAPIRPFGMDPLIIPANTRATGDRTGQLDQRIAGTFVYYPQPFGIQAEWNVGRGPGLNDEQTAVVDRNLTGGYATLLYKFDTGRCDARFPGWGIFWPYTRYQYYRGGYKSIPNAPYGNHTEWNLGVEWQFSKSMELTTEYTFAQGTNLRALTPPGVAPYQEFRADVLRFQFQINY